jgi:VWFA-related protein
MTRVAFRTAAVFVGVLTLGAQNPVYRASVSAVAVEVAVSQRDRPVENLGSGDFRLLDNGIEQKVEVVSAAQIGIDLTVVIDQSGSVRGSLDRTEQWRREAARLLSTEDRLRLISLQHTIREVFPLTTPTSLPDAPLPEADGGTSLYDGLAAVMMSPSSPGRRQLVLVLTDGRDTSSFLGPEHVREVAKLSPVQVEAILVEPSDRQLSGPGLPVASGLSSQAAGGQRAEAIAQAQSRSYADSLHTDPALELLRETTDLTGGRVVSSRAEALNDAFKKSLEDLRRGYVLYFVPSGVERRGWHELTVQIRRPGKYHIRARRGYSVE